MADQKKEPQPTHGLAPQQGTHGLTLAYNPASGKTEYHDVTGKGLDSGKPNPNLSK